MKKSCEYKLAKSTIDSYTCDIVSHCRPFPLFLLDGWPTPIGWAMNINKKRLEQLAMWSFNDTHCMQFHYCPLLPGVPRTKPPMVLGQTLSPIQQEREKVGNVRLGAASDAN